MVIRNMFYRKYRPQTIDELDNQRVREQLEQVLAAKNIPHAFLFVGPKGTGKTSAARILAKSVNCLKAKIEPCNQCEQCRAITNGSHVDVLEIDAASNRGIDEIRSLREKINLAPAMAQYKVYIIDEVHMLTKEAFNALLKTLEEPPQKVIFVLCTTEAEKLLETVVSRCLRIDFHRANLAETERCLRRVVDGEKIKVDEQALTMIAKESRGSFRDATKILEQLSLSGKKIKAEFVAEFLSGQSRFEVDVFIDNLLKKSGTDALEQIQRAEKAGADFSVLAQKILERLHQVLLAKFGVLDTGPSNQYGEIKVGEIKRLIELVIRLQDEFRFSPIPSLGLEMVVIENTQIDTDAAAAGVATSGVEMDRVAARPDKTERMKKKVIDKKSLLPKPGNVDIGKKWLEILKAVKPRNHSVEALLRSCQIEDFDGRVLTIGARYQFHQGRLEEPKIRQLLEMIISQVLDREIKVRCVLAETKSEMETSFKKDSAANLPGSEGGVDDIIRAAEEIFK